MPKEYKLYDSNDILNFGQNKNESFYWIYRLNIKYFEWLILDTEVCFTNIEIFYNYGNPIKLDFENLSDKQKLDFRNIININSKQISRSGSEAYVITIKVLDILIEKGIVSLKNFIKLDYTFPQKVIDMNYNKSINSKPYSNHSDLNTSERKYKYIYH